MAGMQMSEETREQLDMFQQRGAKFVILLGQAGAGKSTLVNRLRDPRYSEPAQAKRSSSSVTLDFKAYPVKMQNQPHLVLLDCPGFTADPQAPLAHVLDKLGVFLGDFGVSFVVVMQSVLNSRIDMGTRFARDLLSHSLMEDKDMEQIILCGTHADMGQFRNDNEFFLSEEGVAGEFFKNHPQLRTTNTVLVGEDQFNWTTGVDQLYVALHKNVEKMRLLESPEGTVASILCECGLLDKKQTEIFARKLKKLKKRRKSLLMRLAAGRGSAASAAGYLAEEGVKDGVEAGVKVSVAEGGKEASELVVKELGELAAEQLTKSASEATIKEAAQVAAKEASEAGVKAGTQVAVKEGTEAGVKAGVHAAVKEGTEAGAKAGVQAAVKEGTEAGVKAGVQTAVKEGTEAGVKAGVQAAVKEGTEAGVKAGVQAAVKEGTEAGVKAGVQAAVKEGTEAGVKAGVQAAVKEGAEAGVKAGVQAAVKEGTEAGVKAGVQAAVKEGTEAGVKASVQAAVKEGTEAGVKGVTTLAVKEGAEQGVKLGVKEALTTSMKAGLTWWGLIPDGCQLVLEVSGYHKTGKAVGSSGNALAGGIAAVCAAGAGTPVGWAFLGGASAGLLMWGIGQAVGEKVVEAGQALLGISSDEDE